MTELVSYIVLAMEIIAKAELAIKELKAFIEREVVSDKSLEDMIKEAQAKRKAQVTADRAEELTKLNA